MNAKRVSYFSFLIAISTIATVSCAHAGKSVKAPLSHTTTMSGPEVQELSLECWMALAKVLESRGLQPGQFKITAYQEGTETQYQVCLEFDRNYKGQVAAFMLDACQPAPYTALLTDVTVSGGIKGFTYAFDLRQALQQKSRILLE